MKTLLFVATVAVTPLLNAADGVSTNTQAASVMTAGEVRKVNKEQGKVTIRHEPLPNLNMPAMTMVFRVKDPAMLDQVKEGDRIRFVAERVDGAITVVQWQTAN